ncbi:MAG: response regulator [Holophagaceae bacterium]|nr:response regulator [Holophagaceae bacterium]
MTISMDTSRKTIFMVDDDITNLSVGAEFLDGHYDVLTFNSGERLLNALEKKIPDLILLDVSMPELDGYEVIGLLKKKPMTAHIPVIFLTAKTDIDSEIEGLSLGAADYIAKPFSPPRLLKRIQIHLLIEAQKQELVCQKNELINFNTNLKEMVEEKTRTVTDLQNAMLKTLADLVESRDNITGGHIERTQGYLGKLLESMKQQGEFAGEVSTLDLGLVLQSAQLHDVGKIAIADSILKKPGKLTAEEFEEIKGHALFGAKIIEKIKEGIKSETDQAFLDYAKIFAATHHEKWDGSGYPGGLKGEGIPLLGRAMAIVDVYDALVSERPYKRAFSREEAVSIIKDGDGSSFDPKIVRLFLDVLDGIG